MTSQHAVEVVDLVKQYPHPEGGELRAVDGLSFTVSHGEVFGMLGPNGAGKTTTLEILEGLKHASGGAARVLGIDANAEPLAIKQRIGIQLQASSYFDQLRLGEILELFGSFYDRRSDPQDLLALVGLTEKRNAKVGELSGGQAQRFSIVAALVNDPEVLFLDEPTTGLDPQARHNVWQLIRAINDRGTTVILTTHYMEEAEVLSDRIAIVDRGRLQALDTPMGLISRLEGGHRISFSSTVPAALQALEGLPGVRRVDASRNGTHRYSLRATEPDVSVPALYQWAATSGVGLQDVQIRTATLEDVFLEITGSSLREG
jgi:ABC-2 type transport system ATP-binding protein